MSNNLPSAMVKAMITISLRCDASQLVRQRTPITAL